MKLIIDISENLYFLIQNKLDFNGMLKEKDIYNLMNIIDDATPIPDNATNSDVMLTMFPNETDLHTFARHKKVSWWNAPYQKVRINDKTVH